MSKFIMSIRFLLVTLIFILFPGIASGQLLFLQDPPNGEKEEEAAAERLREIRARLEVTRTQMASLNEPSETVDPETSRTNFHFRVALRPADLEMLKSHGDLGMLFFTFRNSCTDEIMESLKDVAMRGVSVWNQSVSDAGIKALEKHPTLEKIHLMDLEITDAAVDSIATIPHLKKLNVARCPVTNQAVQRISQLKDLESVNFFGCSDLTDEGIQNLEKIPGLKRLLLNNIPKLTSGVVPALCKLENLERLELDAIELDETDLEKLPNLQKLEYLSLSSTNLSDDGLKIVSQLGSLKTLSMGNTKITDSGLAGLNQLMQLETLKIGKTAITDAGVKTIPGLQRFFAANTAITDASISDLQSKSEKLEWLWIANTKITDKCIVDIAKMPRLTHLDVSGTGIKAEDLTIIEHAHPEIRILRKRSFK